MDRCPCGSLVLHAEHLNRAADTLVTCPIHGAALVTFCPVCRGKAGGSRRSPRKTKAVRRNAKKPRPRHATASPESGDTSG